MGRRAHGANRPAIIKKCKHPLNTRSRARTRAQIYTQSQLKLGDRKRDDERNFYPPVSCRFSVRATVHHGLTCIRSSRRVVHPRGLDRLDIEQRTDVGRRRAPRRTEEMFNYCRSTLSCTCRNITSFWAIPHLVHVNKRAERINTTRSARTEHADR